MKKAVCDMDIINSLKIGQNISVQINDNGINLKNGVMLQMKTESALKYYQ